MGQHLFAVIYTVIIESWPYLWFSVWQAGLTVGLSVVLGGGLAWLEYHTQLSTPRWFILSMTLPVFLPAAIVGIGMIAVWGNAGFINDMLAWLHIPQIQWLYSPWAVIASHCVYNIPLAYLAIRLRLSGIDQETERTAAVVGANSWQQFVYATWPRLRSMVYGVSALIFVYSFTSFALPLILGGARYQTIEVYIYTLLTRQFDTPAALSMATVQLLLLLSILALTMRNIKSLYERRVALASQKQVHSHWWITGLQLVLAGYVLLPAMAVIVRSFQVRSHNVVRWELTNYTSVVSEQFTEALLRSGWLMIAILGSVLVVALVIVLVRTKKISKSVILLLAFSPITLSVFSRQLFGQSMLVLGVSLCLGLLPIAVMLLHTQWLNRPPQFVETLHILGARRMHVLKHSARWLLPTCLQFIALGSVFVLGDLAYASVLAPYRQPTAMVYSYQLFGSYQFGVGTAGMALVLYCVIACVGLIGLLQHHYVTYR